MHLILFLTCMGFGLGQELPMVQKINEHIQFSQSFENPISNKNEEEIDFYEIAYQGVNSPRQSITDSEGNTYITGTSSHVDAPKGNMFTIKYDSAGNLVWEKREETQDFVVEMGFTITLDEENNPIVAGINWNGDNMDIHTTKYDKSNGETIWSSIYDGGFNGLDYPQSITLDYENNIIVGGMSYSVNSNGVEGIGYVTLKYAPDGNLLWSVLDENDVEGVWIEPYKVSTDNQGNIAITGFGANESLYKVYYTIKYSPNGDLIWKNKYMYEDQGSPTNNTASDVKFDTEGNCYVTGTFADSSGESLMGTIKYSPDGTTVWVKEHQSPGHITLGYHVEIMDETVYVGGMHRNFDQTGGSIVASYSAEEGTENWIQESNNLQILGDNIGNYVQFQLTDSFPVISVWGQRDFNNVVEVRKYDIDGTLTMEKTYTKENLNTYSLGGVIGLGLDQNNDLYLSLNPRYTQYGEVYELIKLEENQEIPVWEKRYDNMGGGSITLNQVIPGPDGTMTAIGYHGVIDEELNYLTNFLLIQYNANGTIAWEKSYSSLTGYNANRILVNTDEQGNIYLLLTPNPFDMETKLTLQKITPTGEISWEIQKEMILPEGYIKPLIDNEGNVYLAGAAHESEDTFQPLFNVLKFNSNGEEEWNEFIPANEGDNLFLINAGTFDQTGNLVLTGHSGVGSFFSQTTNISLFQITPTGTLNWMEHFSVSGWNSGATGVYMDGESIYVSAWKENQNDMNLGDMVVLKYNNQGEFIWDKSYTEAGRRIRPYDILTNSQGDIVITGFSNHISTMINRVIALKYDEEGNLIWNKTSEDLQYFRDMYIDDADNIYILNQEYSSTHPNRIFYAMGPFTTANIMKISTDGNLEYETFIGDELSPLNPTSLVPFQDGRLLIATEMLNEQDHFKGIKFFETTHEVLGIDEETDEISGNWLGQNYPNPAQTTTSIPFRIERSNHVEIQLYNVQGKLIRTITNQNYPAGKHTVEINTSAIPRGIYFYQLKSPGFVKSLKLIVK